MPAYVFALAAPIILFLAGIAGLVVPTKRPSRLPRLVESACLAALAAAIAAAISLAQTGPSSSPLLGIGGVGLALRIDVVSSAMLLLVCFVGWVVLRYSVVYLDGEARQNRFMGWICLTLMSVVMLVLSGNVLQLILFWISTSLALHQLLLFYPDRIAAQRAARKKFVIARMSDAMLVMAGLMLWGAYGSADIGSILQAARSGAGGTLAVAAATLLALAALLKSAQFPTHSWLTEVMETPTPTSALLHAGVINAGGFLLIRFADVMLLAPITMAVLVIIGGFTALFGSLVMLTQPAVKTSLAWSTVAQMGFMIMQCGLALFPLALLHILAHSLYKAHAFLASGGAIGRIAQNKRPGPIAIASPAAVGRSFLLALTIFVVLAISLGMTKETPQAIALGAILIFGIAYLLTQGLAQTSPRQLTKSMIGYSLAASLSYFALQSLAFWMTSETLPATPEPGSLQWLLIIVAVVSFAAVAIAQAMFPLWAYHPAVAGMRVHFANGFYVNAMFDRLLDSWRIPARPLNDRKD